MRNISTEGQFEIRNINLVIIRNLLDFEIIEMAEV
jgi:hypothetical protein